MRTFTLLSDSDDILTSGMLRKPLLDCFHGEDDYQFENKEFLICIERDNVNSAPQRQPISKPAESSSSMSEEKCTSLSTKPFQRNRSSLRKPRVCTVSSTCARQEKGEDEILEEPNSNSWIHPNTLSSTPLTQFLSAKPEVRCQRTAVLCHHKQ